MGANSPLFRSTAVRRVADIFPRKPSTLARNESNRHAKTNWLASNVSATPASSTSVQRNLCVRTIWRLLICRSNDFDGTLKGKAV